MKTSRINLNTMATRIAEAEGGAVNLSIAQVKEVLRLALDYLAVQAPSEVLALLERRR